ncbi:hypothetical protein [Euzebya tangerina]|uniref:hypothetical protein n=1 Tax=Euzebya tangerina TaxID=591198 RepID=UPI000E318106|nr:hypothetical protein [Euzebya tangerina]
MDLDAALTALDRQMVEARPVPLSASVMVNKDELEQISAAIKAALPEEIRQAKWVLKERDQLLAQASRDAEQIVADGQLERDRMLSETEIVREAQREAQRIVDRASEEGRKLHHEAENFVDAKLADFEAMLQKTLSTVARGRDRLQGRQPGMDPLDTDRGEDPTIPGGIPMDGRAESTEPDGLTEDSSRKVAKFFDHNEAL